MIRARQFILGFILLLGMTSLAAANSGRLVADLSKSNIAITSGFHGTDLLLFGAVDGAEQAAGSSCAEQAAGSSGAERPSDGCSCCPRFSKGIDCKCVVSNF